MAHRINPTGPNEKNVVYHFDDDTRTYRYTNPVATVVWWIAGIITAVLGLRFLLRLFGANPEAGFTEFIYNIAEPFRAPFANIFPITNVNGAGVWEWSTILAIAIYLLVAGVIASLFSPRSRTVLR